MTMELRLDSAAATFCCVLRLVGYPWQSRFPVLCKIYPLPMCLWPGWLYGNRMHSVTRLPTCCMNGGLQQIHPLLLKSSGAHAAVPCAHAMVCKILVAGFVFDLAPSQPLEAD